MCVGRRSQAVLRCLRECKTRFSQGAHKSCAGYCGGFSSLVIARILLFFSMQYGPCYRVSSYFPTLVCALTCCRGVFACMNHGLAQPSAFYRGVPLLAEATNPLGDII